MLALAFDKMGGRGKGGSQLYHRILGSQQQNEHSVIDYLAVNKLFSNT